MNTQSYQILVDSILNTGKIDQQLNEISKTRKIKLEVDPATGKEMRTLVSKTTKLRGEGNTVVTTFTKMDASGKNVAKTFQTVTEKAKKTEQSLGEVIFKVGKFALATAILGAFTTGIYKAFDSVISLDKALTELRKVTDLSGEGLKNFTKEAFKVGEEVAKTGEQVIIATTEFAKAGYDSKQSMELAKVALMYQNIADEEVSAADSASFIVSQMKAFNIEAKDAMHIIDGVNQVSNQYSVSSADLAENLGKVSATASSAGVGFENLIGLVTAGTELNRDASKTTNSLKTIFVKLEQMNSSGTALKLSSQFKDFNIEMTNLDGTSRSAYEILKDLSVVYNDLYSQAPSKENTDRKNQLRTLLEDMAGVHNISALESILKNFKTATGATETALNSFGSAVRENAAYLDSIEGKLNKFSSAWSYLASAVLDSNLIKSFIDFGTIIGKLAGSDLGVFIIQVGLLTVAIFALTGGIKSLNVAFANLNKTMLFNPLFWKVAAIAAGIMLIVSAADALNVTYEEQLQKVEDLRQEIEDLEDKRDNLEGIKNRTLAEQKLLDLYNKQIDAKKVLEAQDNKKVSYKAVYGDLFKGGALLQSSATENFANRNIKLYNSKLEKGDLKATSNIAKDLIENYNTLIQSTIELEQNIGNLDEKEKQQVQTRIDQNYIMMSTIEALGILGNKTSDVSDVISENSQDLTENKKRLSDFEAELKTLNDAYDTGISILSDWDDDNQLSIDTILDVINNYDDWQSILTVTTNGIELNRQALVLSTQAKIKDAIATKMLAGEDASYLEQLLAATEKSLNAPQGKGSGGSKKDEWKEAFDTKYNLLKHELAMEEITEAQYTEKLEKLYKKYFANNKKYAEDYNRYQEEVYTKRKEIAEKEVKKFQDDYKARVQDLEHSLFCAEQKENSEQEQVELYKKLQEEAHAEAERLRATGVAENDDYLQELGQQWWKYQKKILDIEEETVKKLKEQRKEYLEDFVDKTEAMQEVLELYAEEQQDVLQKEIDKLNEEKEALQESNEARQEAIRLQQLEMALAEAKSKKVLIFREGVGFVYEADKTAIANAQKELNEYNNERNLQKKLDNIDKEIAGYEEQKQAWADVVNNHKRMQDKMILEEKLGKSIEKTILDARIDNIQNFAREYKKVLSDLIDAQKDLNDLQEDSGSSKSYKTDNGNTVIEHYDSNGNNTSTTVSDGKGGSVTIENPYPTKKKKYASGITSIPFDQIATVDENGSELRVPPSGQTVALRKGTGVIPAGMTENLMRLGQYSFEQLRSIFSNTTSAVGSSNSSTTINNFDKIVLPNVVDGDSFVKELLNFKNLAIQTGNKR